MLDRREAAIVAARAAEPRPARIPVVALGMALGTFLAITFALCVAFDFRLPGYAMHSAWAPLLPGFTWISWQSVVIGLAETFAYGWYVALLFAPLYNLFARWRISRRPG